MNEKLIRVLQESIELELKIAELYQLFHNVFPQDNEFWWNLILEEKNHAALLRTLKEVFLPIGKFPVRLLSTSLHEFQQTNAAITETLQKCRAVPPSRTEAYHIAYALEQSAAELHYQKFMANAPDSDIDRLFQQLNNHDKDHAARLRIYFEPSQTA
jgi:rubrerythrin